MASNTEKTVVAIGNHSTKTEETTKAVQELQRITRDKSVEVDGFMGVIKSNQKTQQHISDLTQAVIDNPAKLERKVEEVKSAQLITNQELKKLNKKEAPVPKDFPTEMAVTIKGISVITIKGDKGDAIKGDKGDKGEPGKDGKNGTDGKNGKNGRDGAAASDGKNGKDGNDGVDGSPDTPDEIVAKVNLSEKKIDGERVRGFAELFRQVDSIGSFPRGKEAGGGGNVIRYLSNGVVISAYVTELNFSTNILPTYDGNGRITLTAMGGGGTTYSETPSGLVNGSNKIYTTLHTVTTVINFAINGAYIHPADYSVVGTTITFVTALDASLSGLPFTIVYQS